MNKLLDENPPMEKIIKDAFTVSEEFYSTKYNGIIPILCVKLMHEYNTTIRYEEQEFSVILQHLLDDLLQCLCSYLKVTYADSKMFYSKVIDTLNTVI